ncbi:TonB family protein [Mariprofundus sp. NF]|uniref:TonB family protein n=1 Tax=Mariprofundus sp. NF TaxID=2608716 RepID=UPI00159FEC28|nr:TonB family protein [Mariprofundus sp. NF]NWF37595.1 TonB family protein [Mariprofundus sp. NF]
MLAFQLLAQNDTLHIQADEGATLQVELVKKAESPEQTATPQAKAAAPQKQTKQITPAVAPIVHKEIKELAESPLPERPQKTTPQALKQSPEVVKTTVVVEPESHAVTGASMPSDVQQMILSHISYPRKARRKGWQGNAMFNLAVHEQKLARLDLSLSSGHSLLDRAAMRGIRAIDHLPLANGTYRLPVEFKLQ